MEQEMISHFSHHHPLTPIPDLCRMRGMRSWCIGCRRYFVPGEAAYGCSNKCGYPYRLHKKCLEMVREINLPVHPHPLKQVNWYRGNWICRVCEGRGFGMCYICSEGCEFLIHLRCAVDAFDEEVRAVQHIGHPHQLIYLRMPWSFQCDACGTTKKGSSYRCNICQFWIHESCASLPRFYIFPHHHCYLGYLSLATRLPSEYSHYEYTCDVCRGGLRMEQWVYHCELCRYVAHIKCATNTSLATNNNEEEVDDSKDIIRFPINEANEELINPFVKREIKERGIGVPHEDNKIINGKYQFHKHPHPLKLIMSSSSSDYNEEEDEDDDEDNHSGILQLLCDGCTMPIHEHKQRSSPKYYLSCGECKYFLHGVCFDLPLELSCLPIHSDIDHKLTLRNSNKLTNWVRCSICGRPTNGLYYGCTKCDFKVDVICASLPHTIKHAAHPQRHHYLKLGRSSESKMERDMISHFSHLDNQNEQVVANDICLGCYTCISDEVISYRCDSCRFTVCRDCVLLPASNKHRSEKHLLMLTYDANFNHPSEFYCGDCEEQMDPKSWMYHCRECDQSFHPSCFLATSGWYRNLNFGTQEYMITPCHPHHPLRFQLIIKKKYCDLCHGKAYDKLGFQCASCNFAMCFSRCGAPYLKTMKAIN